VVDEIEWLQKTYGFEEFIIEDENFTFYKSHVTEFADELTRRKIKCYFSFPNGVRLDRLDDEIVRRLAEMGTYVACLGIESGSRATLDKMDKHWDFDMVRERVLLFKKYGIIVNGSFILGYRDETMEDIEKTIAYALSLPIDMAYFGNYLPLPGSVDFNFLVERGDLDLNRIDWEHYNSYAGVLPYHPKQVSETQLMKAVKKATLRFYLRPRIALGFLKRMTSLVFIKSFFFRLSHIMFGK
jgi:anaerobic magnesium-protoporphyrin IX monomethyl ester cyclase